MRLPGTSRVFRNRRDAGALLAAEVARALGGDGTAGEDVVVAGLPRGGVAVAAEVARALDAPLDVVVVRKLGLPWQPELAVGAVGGGGVRVLNDSVARLVHPEELEELTRREAAEVERREAAWRGAVAGADVEGRTVVLVDDGIATGATVRAAIAVLRARSAGRIVLAVPVASPEVLAALRPLVDEVVCLRQPRSLQSVGSWYADFRQVQDAEVRGLIEELRRTGGAASERAVPTDAGPMPAVLTVPQRPRGLVLFAHGAGSSRLSPRNRRVADRLRAAGLATVLLDLLTEDEARDRARVFDIELLAARLLAATEWAGTQPGTRDLPLGYFGASTGAAAALRAAADRPPRLAAVVSRGGRPDLAGPRLADVLAPTLLVVGGLDTEVLGLNRDAQRLLRCENRLEVVPGASHLFEEPGTLDRVAELAAGWFGEHLPAASGQAGVISP